MRACSSSSPQATTTSTNEPAVRVLLSSRGFDGSFDDRRASFRSWLLGLLRWGVAAVRYFINVSQHGLQSKQLDRALQELCLGAVAKTDITGKNRSRSDPAPCGL